jgi:putative transposase
MPRRTLPLATGQVYHLANFGASRQPIFLDQRDYQRFFDSLSYYRLTHPALPRFSHFLRLAKSEQASLAQKQESSPPLVNILTYLLMPNHFHFILQQTSDDGISTFLTKLQNSYVRHFNAKHHRSGSLFSGAFKATRLETPEQLLHLSRYLHIEPVTSYLIKEPLLTTYQWSSFPDYLKGESSLLDLEPVLSSFSTPEMYKAFIFDQQEYQKSFPTIQHLTLET